MNTKQRLGLKNKVKPNRTLVQRVTRDCAIYLCQFVGISIVTAIFTYIVFTLYFAL